VALRQPTRAKERADEIADLISAAGEKIIELSLEWFELNDERGLSHARRMLDAREVKLMLSAHLEASGAARIALNLLRTDVPMPRPFFEVQAPMLPWTLNSANVLTGGPERERMSWPMPERNGKVLGKG
jgi:hypothetical protein